MFILDTNVVSELRKASVGKADKNVVTWAMRCDPASLFLSVITVLELEIGILRKERVDARQGAVLRTWLERAVIPAFTDRIFPIDLRVARRCAVLHVPNRGASSDMLIAATGLVHGMIVVTRNERDFAQTGVRLLNPWK